MTLQRARPLRGRPRVSVVVPCYRYGHYLSACVGSIVTQTDVDVDVLVVDDASPDDSPAVARRLAAADPRVRVMEHQSNQGHIATYNDGLAEVEGEFVVLLSADDLLPRGSLGRAVALMQARPDVDLVYGWAASFSGAPRPDGGRTVGWSVWGGDAWLSRSCRRGRSFIVSPEVVMRASALRALGGYDPRLPHSADMALWLRAAAGGGAVGRIHGPPQAHYRVHADNMHLTSYVGMLHDLGERRRTFDLVLDEGGDEGPETARLRHQARRALAVEALRHARRHLATPDADPSVAADYAAFARETWPAVVHAAAWQAHRLASANRLGARGARIARAGQGLSDRLAWRRWRYGGRT